MTHRLVAGLRSFPGGHGFNPFVDGFIPFGGGVLGLNPVCGGGKGGVLGLNPFAVGEGKGGLTPIWYCEFGAYMGELGTYMGELGTYMGELGTYMGVLTLNTGEEEDPEEPDGLDDPIACACCNDIAGICIIRTVFISATTL